jgi:hypothetical protein
MALSPRSVAYERFGVAPSPGLACRTLASAASLYADHLTRADKAPWVLAGRLRSPTARRSSVTRWNARSSSVTRSQVNALFGAPFSTLISVSALARAVIGDSGTVVTGAAAGTRTYTVSVPQIRASAYRSGS